MVVVFVPCLFTCLCVAHCLVQGFVEPRMAHYMLACACREMKRANLLFYTAAVYS